MADVKIYDGGHSEGKDAYYFREVSFELPLEEPDVDSRLLAAAAEYTKGRMDRVQALKFETEFPIDDDEDRTTYKLLRLYTE